MARLRDTDGVSVFAPRALLEELSKLNPGSLHETCDYLNVMLMLSSVTMRALDHPAFYRPV